MDSVRKLSSLNVALSKQMEDQATTIDDLLVKVSEWEEMEVEHSNCVTRREELQSSVALLIATREEQQNTISNQQGMILKQQDTIHKLKEENSSLEETVNRLAVLLTKKNNENDEDTTKVMPTLSDDVNNQYNQPESRYYPSPNMNHSSGCNGVEAPNLTQKPPTNEDLDTDDLEVDVVNCVDNLFNRSESSFSYSSNSGSLDCAGTEFNMDEEIGDNDRDEGDNTPSVSDFAQQLRTVEPETPGNPPALDSTNRRSARNLGKPRRLHVESDSDHGDDDGNKLKKVKKTRTSLKPKSRMSLKPKSTPRQSYRGVRPEKGDPNRHIHHGIRYVLTPQNNEAVAYKSHKYTFHRHMSGGKTYWRCRLFGGTCKAALLLDADGAPINDDYYEIPHNHPPPTASDIRFGWTLL